MVALDQTIRGGAPSSRAFLGVERSFIGRRWVERLDPAGTASALAIAQRLGVPATLGDPLARLVKDEVAKTTVDLRQPQPGWAIAAGLGIGLVPQSNEKSE